MFTIVVWSAVAIPVAVTVSAAKSASVIALLHSATCTTATMLTVAIVLIAAPTTHIMPTTITIPRTTTTHISLIRQTAPQLATDNG